VQRDTEGLDPFELKQSKQGGRPKDDNADLILAVFRSCDPEGGTTARQVSESTLIKKRTIQRRIKELIPQRITIFSRRNYQSDPDRFA